jgi:hypothetical protein
MTTPGGLIRKQVYLSPEAAEGLQREVARRRQLGEEATESGVFRELLEKNLLRAVHEEIGRECERRNRGTYAPRQTGALRSW